MSRYREADLSKVKTVSLRKRGSRVHTDLLYRPPSRLASFDAFWDSLPEILGAADLRAVVHAILTSRSRGRPVIALCGAHVLKTGMGPGLIRLIREGILTGLAFNGAGVIHDVELALWGATSEDVGEGLHDGRFGMSGETATFVNDAARTARDRREGFGEALGRLLLVQDPGLAHRSVLAAAYKDRVPVTIHVGIGTDVVHQHPGFDGGATGEASATDFRILAAELLEMAGGTFLNLGSAVLLPEVFLKAFSVACNLGASPRGITTAAFDFIRHYRPQENIVRRPTIRGGKGYYIVGHHEILLPLLIHACLREKAKAPPRRRPRTNKPLKRHQVATDSSLGNNRRKDRRSR